jgi:hypothetical protein
LQGRCLANCPPGQAVGDHELVEGLVFCLQE